MKKAEEEGTWVPGLAYHKLKKLLLHIISFTLADIKTGANNMVFVRRLQLQLLRDVRDLAKALALTPVRETTRRVAAKRKPR